MAARRDWGESIKFNFRDEVFLTLSIIQYQQIRCPESLLRENISVYENCRENMIAFFTSRGVRLE